MKKISVGLLVIILLVIVTYQTDFFNKTLVSEQVSLNAEEYSMYDFELDQKTNVKISCKRLEGAVVEWLLIDQKHLEEDLFIGDIIDNPEFREYGLFISTDDGEAQRFTLEPGAYTVILNNTKHGNIYPSDFVQQDSTLKVEIEIVRW
ncbi:hypothetical protein MWH28_08475 [Natroniella sulfidigena]|uniref:hypothetical protein n=1 Tax=Natroniella sulfidigena TaxID=723921 RepID=UPI00200B9F1D|nr:hypothetical protein [Natroniella sulfidigena]MCK8817391.1 hypothetical protein [Natroniella sulfidigena]